MNFNSVNYMIFLPVVAGLYFAVPQKYKNLWLLAVSYYFYYCNEARFFLLLPAMTLITYGFGLAVDKREGKKRDWLFICGLFANLGVLVFFKYNRFFLGRISALTGAQIDFSWWLLPMGISFYIFMAASYIIDIYLKKYHAEKDVVKFAAYITFFPHILMGPIDRANKFIPQLDKEHKFEYERVRKALQLMAIGFFKKIAVADVLAMFVNQVHSDLYSYTGIILVFVAFMYSYQLYADFSGYCDIARGSAMIMGFDITENFNVPYLSTSFSQFWSRWHISLSSWFQDYIFTPFVWTNPVKKLPLIGQFFEKPPVLMAVALVFITSGIWHGNTWNFVIWGLCHAVYRMGEEIMRRRKKPNKHPKPLEFWSKVVWVFSLVTFSQIFFRCKDIPASLYYIANMFGDFSLSTFGRGVYNAVKSGFDATPMLIYAYIAYNVLTLAILMFMDWYRHFRLKGKCLTNGLDRQKPAVRWLCYYVMIGLIMAGFIMNNGGFGASASFIYNNF